MSDGSPPRPTRSATMETRKIAIGTHRRAVAARGRPHPGHTGRTIHGPATRIATLARRTATTGTGTAAASGRLGIAAGGMERIPGIGRHNPGNGTRARNSKTANLA